MLRLNFITSFIEQVKKAPESVALINGTEKISYGALMSESLKVGDYLKKRANGAAFIGIQPTQGIRDYCHIIGTWLYGAAYVPLADHFSQERREEIKEELGINMVLGPDTESLLKNSELPVAEDFLINEIVGVVQKMAYVIFTSGSTGKPKGVPVSKENLNAFTAHYLNKNKYDFTTTDRFLQSYELSFDVSVFCYAVPLMTGGAVVLLENKGVKYMSIIAGIIKYKITVCSNVPSVAKYAGDRLNEIQMDSLRYSFFSGESLRADWAKRWMNAAKNAQVYNCYGPTETTIVCSTEHLNSLPSSYFKENKVLPLGKPFETVEFLIHEGEICISGKQVFEGYSKQSTPKLIINEVPFFLTGDCGHYDQSQKLIFEGRKDQQVQVNGYRIELAATDHLITEKFGTLSKTYLFQDEQKQDLMLTAIEARTDQENAVYCYLSQELPDYAVPHSVVSFSSFPINKNGKLDHGVLKKNLLTESAKRISQR